MRGKLPIRMIKWYQRNKRTSGRCHFQPSCSNYAIEAYQKFNFFHASFLTFMRLIRCTPLTKRRYDPVPLTKTEKKNKLILEEVKQAIGIELTNTIINQYHKYPLMETEDYLILIKECLGLTPCSHDVTEYTALEQLANDKIRLYTKERIAPDEPSSVVAINTAQYLNNLTKLMNAGWINNFQESLATFCNTSHSQSYLTNYESTYYIVNANELSQDFWLEYLKHKLKDSSLINITGGIEQHHAFITKLAQKLNAQIIDLSNTKEITNHKYLNHILSKKVFEKLNDKKINILIKKYCQNKPISIDITITNTKLIFVGIDHLDYSTAYYFDHLVYIKNEITPPSYNFSDYIINMK